MKKCAVSQDRASYLDRHPERSERKRTQMSRWEGYSMRNMINPAVRVVLLTLGAMLATTVVGQIAPDPSLLAEINKIKAVDNHTHVGKVVGPGEQDRDFDALPCDVIEAGADTLMSSADNPQLVGTWKKLYGYRYDDPAHVKELIAAREKVMREQGDHFPTWVLDQLGTQYML